MKDFLQQHGATLENGRCHFGESGADYNALENELVISVLDSQGLLEVRDGQSSKCLQGQLTCDVLKLETGQSTLGAYCTPKGRMICNFRLASPASEHFMLRMSSACVEATKNTLGKYSPFFKCTITNISDQYTILGISGDRARRHLQDVFGAAPQGAGHTTHGEDFSLLCIEEDRRYECWLTNTALQNRWEQLTKQAKLTGEEFWQLHNIRAGIGEVSEQTIEEWIPQMLNLQAIGAINFRKGCYTGQEIVARTQYRGQLKRAMYRLKVEGNALPTPGTPVIQEEKTAGEVVQAAFSNNDSYEVLAVLNSSVLEKTTPTLTIENKPATVASLPYSIETEKPQT
ncbi:MAG: folate-binding protein YgfZ [Pseudomonadales bacterium]|nr:folate-binding protein YgfZ [Pseudomonadales bacterium]